ncbi:MAG: AraC family transcriptional regulator [Bacteroidota bacterium]
MTPRFYLVDEAQRAIFLNNYYSYPEVKIISVIRWLTPVLYISWTYLELHRSRQLMLENYSDDRLLLLKWLWQLNTLNLFIFLVSSIKGLLRFQLDGYSFHFVRLAMVIVLISFLVWIVMKALYHPKLFRGIDVTLPSVSKLVAESKEENISKEKQADLDRILQYMQQKQPYLDASLSLQKLARQLSLPSHELSLLINHHLGKHFFDFVNEYRIRAAQQILIDPAQKAKTVLEILYEVGFNSKSSFNTAFRKHTDMTPTEYRKGKRV